MGRVRGGGGGGESKLSIGWMEEEEGKEQGEVG